MNGKFSYDKENGVCEIVIPLLPYTKKNSQEIKYRYIPEKKKSVPYIISSENFKLYQRDCGWFLKDISIDYPVNVEAHYYMDTMRIVDLNNLHSALHDILVHYHVLKDDNAKIIVSTDGSRVFYDKENPRTEIIITKADRTFKK